MPGDGLHRVRWLLAGVAPAGVVAAHILSYLITTPDPHARGHLLEQTGHQGWTLVATVTLAFLGACLARFVTRSASSSDRENRLARGSLVAVWWRMGALQVLGFLALETAERLAAHDPLSGLVSEPAVILGTLLQIIVALIGALLVLAICRAVQIILSIGGLPSASHSIASWPLAGYAVPPRFTVATGAGTLRGPPSIS